MISLISILYMSDGQAGADLFELGSDQIDDALDDVTILIQGLVLY